MAVLGRCGRAVDFDLDVGTAAQIDSAGGGGPKLAGGKLGTARERNSIKRLSRGADYQAGREVRQLTDAQRVARTSAIDRHAPTWTGKIRQLKRGAAQSRQPVS